MISSALAGGVIGTLAMTTIIKTATELGLTRMDFALLLGTAFTDNRRKARATGYIVYFALGVAFAEAYGAFFAIVGHASWQLGALLGVLHAIFVATVLFTVLLPVVHPRMATSLTRAATAGDGSPVVAVSIDRTRQAGAAPAEEAAVRTGSAASSVTPRRSRAERNSRRPRSSWLLSVASGTASRRAASSRVSPSRQHSTSGAR